MIRSSATGYGTTTSDRNRNQEHKQAIANLVRDLGLNGGEIKQESDSSDSEDEPAVTNGRSYTLPRNGHSPSAHMNGHSHLPHTPVTISSKTISKDKLQALTNADLSTFNAIVDNYCEQLIKFSKQFFKGDSQWQILASELWLKLTQLQSIFNDEHLEDEVRIAAVRQINHEFGKAIQSRVNNNYALLRVRSWSSWLLGDFIISIKDLLLNFLEEDAPRINILLMKYEDDYIDYKMDEELIKAQEIIGTLKVTHKEDRELENIDSAFQILYAEFLSYPEPLLGKWYGVASRIQVLLEKAVQVTEAGSDERKFAKRLQVYLNEIYPPADFKEGKPRALDVGQGHSNVEITIIGQKKPRAPIVVEGNANVVITINQEEPAGHQPEEDGVAKATFEQIYVLVSGMKKKLFDLCDRPLAPQPLASLLKKKIRGIIAQIHEVEQGLETGYEAELELYSEAMENNPNNPDLFDYNTQDPFLIEQQKERVKKHLVRAKLMAVYDFCYHYSSVDLSSDLKNYRRTERRAREKSDFIAKITKMVFDDTRKIRELADKIDVDGSIYSAFLDEKDIENISVITTLQRQHLQRYMAQLWKGGSTWQLVAKDLEEELKKFQEILVDKGKKTLYRLAAATEILNVIDYFIQARVGNQLHQLQQHTIVTEALQLFSESSALRKISIKDIFYHYRQNYRPVVQQGVKNIAMRLNANDHGKYVYQTNFRDIFDKVGLWVFQLNEYVKVKDPQHKTDHGMIALKLMDSLASRALRFGKEVVSEADADLVQCLMEAEHTILDVNGAIVAFMDLYYQAKFAPAIAAAERESSDLIRLSWLNAIANSKEELLYGKAKKRLVCAVRDAVDYIEIIHENPRVLIDAVLEKTKTDQPHLEYLLSWKEGEFVGDFRHNQDENAIKELLNTLTIIIGGTNPPVDYDPEENNDWVANQLKEISENIEVWLGFYHPKEETLSDRKELMKIIRVEVATFLFKLYVRMDAKKTIDEAVKNFTSKEQKKDLLTAANSVLEKIDNQHQKLKCKIKIQAASRFYDKHHNEQVLLRRFKLEYVQTSPVLSGLARILLNFKLYIEILIKGWMSAIKEELIVEQQRHAFELVEQRRMALSIPIGTLPSNVYGLLQEIRRNPPAMQLRTSDDISSLNTIISPGLHGQSRTAHGSGSPQAMSLAAPALPPAARRATTTRNGLFSPLAPPLSGNVVARSTANGLPSNHGNGAGASHGSIFRPTSATTHSPTVEPLLNHVKTGVSISRVGHR
jgi:hypothetical protein